MQVSASILTAFLAGVQKRNHGIPVRLEWSDSGMVIYNRRTNVQLYFQSLQFVTALALELGLAVPCAFPVE